MIYWTVSSLCLLTGKTPSPFNSFTSLTCKQVDRAEALLQFTQKYSKKTVWRQRGNILGALIINYNLLTAINVDLQRKCEAVRKKAEKNNPVNLCCYSNNCFLFPINNLNKNEVQSTYWINQAYKWFKCL